MRGAVTKVLPYKPEDLFDLVADVESYPEFLPWVTAMRTWNRREQDDGKSSFDAEAAVRFSIIRERFSTRVKLDRCAHRIDTSLLSGPFRRLENHWRFEPADGGSNVEFAIEFEFGTRLLQGLLQANAHRAVARLMAAFEARAAKLYNNS